MKKKMTVSGLHAMRAQRGAALLICLWALLLLSAAVLAWAKFIQQGIDEDNNANRGLQAIAMAYSGADVALNPQVTPLTPLLTNDVTPNYGYAVTMAREGGRLNLNYLLAGSRPDRLQILKTYFTLRGLTMDQTDQLVDAMLDWVSPSSLHHLNGATDDPNYHPPHRPFLTLDEVSQVKFSAPLVSLPHWQDDFTLYSSGVVDLQSASLLVLESLPGVDQSRARTLIQVRSGADQKDNTADDIIFQNVNQALSYLGYASNTAPPALTAIAGLDNSTFRIVSVGHDGKVHRQLEIVARKQGNRPQILLWKEN